LVLKVIALISWVAFIEDLIAMDDVFFTPELITGQITQILRPVYLMAILLWCSAHPIERLDMRPDDPFETE